MNQICNILSGACFIMLYLIHKLKIFFTFNMDKS